MKFKIFFLLSIVFPLFICAQTDSTNQNQELQNLEDRDQESIETQTPDSTKVEEKKEDIVAFDPSSMPKMDGKYRYVEEVSFSVPGDTSYQFSMEDLYNNCVNWMLKEYEDPISVTIKRSIPEQTILIENTVSEGQAKYRMWVRFKNDRYRIDVKDLKKKNNAENPDDEWLPLIESSDTNLLRALDKDIRDKMASLMKFMEPKEEEVIEDW